MHLWLTWYPAQVSMLCLSMSGSERCNMYLPKIYFCFKNSQLTACIGLFSYHSDWDFLWCGPFFFTCRCSIWCLLPREVFMCWTTFSGWTMLEAWWFGLHNYTGWLIHVSLNFLQRNSRFIVCSRLLKMWTVSLVLGLCCLILPFLFLSP